MIRVRKEFKFEAAHSLSCHAGHCCETHGHSYKLIIEAIGTPKGVTRDEPESGMVADFGRIKSIVKSEVLNDLDHSHLNELFKENAVIATSWGASATWMLYPTAEHMVIAIYYRLIERFFAVGITLVRIEVHETDTSCASWDIRDSSNPFHLR